MASGTAATMRTSAVHTAPTAAAAAAATSNTPGDRAFAVAAAKSSASNTASSGDPDTNTVDKHTKKKQSATVYDAMIQGPTGLFDCAVNLTHPALAHDAHDVLSRASSVGVASLVAVGTSEQNSAETASLAESLDGHAGVQVLCTAGVHPHDAGAASDEFEGALQKVIQKYPRVCAAIGECGLDFDRDFSPRDVQREVFRRQLRLAKALQMPVLAHCRDAHESLVHALDAEGLPNNTSDVLVHCFTGTAEEADALVRLGCFVGVTGWLADDRAGRAEQVAPAVRQVGLHRLVIETDSPFLTPRNIRPSKKRPRTNEPCLLPHVLSAATNALDTSTDTVAAHTAHNARSFFRCSA